MKITVQALVRAPLATVWSAWSDPEAIRVWNTASPDWHTTASTVDLRAGGQFSSRMEAKDGSFGFDFAGTYTAVEPMRLIVSMLGHRELRVEFSEGPEGVTVRETFDGENTHSEEQQRAGWQAILDSFVRYLEARA